MYWSAVCCCGRILDIKSLKEDSGLPDAKSGSRDREIDPEKEEGLGTRSTLQRHAPSDPVPPAGPHILIVHSAVSSSAHNLFMRSAPS